jgi:hypothetical protein
VVDAKGSAWRRAMLTQNSLRAHFWCNAFLLSANLVISKEIQILPNILF